MRAVLWLLALFAVAVASALFAGNNQGTITLFWPPYRLDLSLNLVLLLLVLGFAIVYAALRGLAALLALPHEAQRWRLQQKERAMHAALLDALAQFMAGRFLRSRKAALLALAQEAALSQAGEQLQHSRSLRALAHLIAAEDSHALQDQRQRALHLQQALEQASGHGKQHEQALREGIQLRAARWALEDRDARSSLEWLAALPQGAARRTLALRLRLKATRHARQTQEALETTRLLAKHRAFSATAAQSMVRGLATELLDSVHDPLQLQQVWQSLEPAERAMPELAVHAAQRLSLLGGEAAQVRHWLLPAWPLLQQYPCPLSDVWALKLVCSLEASLHDIDSAWLARIETAAQAHPQQVYLQYLAGVACMQRQLWGKAQQLLAACSQQLPDASLRRRAWLHLATLAEQRGDTAAAHAAWRQAAQAESSA